MKQDKAWIELQGRPLVARLVAVLQPLFDPLRIVAGDPARFRELGLPVQPDLRPDCGALGGIHSALATATHDRVFVVACDLPLLDEPFLRGLVGLLGKHDAVVPFSGERPVPVCALYRTRCLPAVEIRLDRGELRAAGFLADIDVRWIREEELAVLDPEGMALFNMNTGEDYERVRRILSRRRP